MATTTTPSTLLPSLPPATGRAGLRGAIASEFTKIRSVRSTYWTLAALLVVSIGIGAAITGGSAANFSHNPGQQGRVRRHPDLTGRVLRDRPADHRGDRRAGDHLRVLHRDDTHLPDRAAPARHGLCREGDRAHVADAHRLPRHVVRRRCGICRRARWIYRSLGDHRRNCFATNGG